LDKSGGFYSSTSADFKTAAIFAALAGASYGILGVLQIIVGIGLVIPNALISDPIGGIMLFVLQLIILGTNALGWWLQLEDWSGWVLHGDLTPALLLFLPTLLVAIPMHREKRGEKTKTDNEKGGID